MIQCPIPIPMSADPAVQQISQIILQLLQAQQSPTSIAQSLFQTPGVKDVMPAAPPSDGNYYILAFRNGQLAWLAVSAC